MKSKGSGIRNTPVRHLSCSRRAVGTTIIKVIWISGFGSGGRPTDKKNAGAWNIQCTRYESLVRVVQLLDTAGAVSNESWPETPVLQKVFEEWNHKTWFSRVRLN